MKKSEIVKNISIILANLNTKTKHTHEYSRLLGGIEGMLICIGKLEIQGDLPYSEVVETRVSWPGKVKTSKRKETYAELIIRLATEVIRENL